MSLGRKTSRRSPWQLETLEDRLALSWAGVPPAVVTISTSTALTLGANGAATGTGAITHNETDFFHFTAPRSGNYRISALTPTSNLDPVLGVFSADGRRLAYNDDISRTNTDSQLTINLTQGQRYFFGITNYTGTAGGSYTWSVQGPQSGPSGDDSFEENDSLAQASNLGSLSARRVLNNLVMADASDWFRFSMSSSGSTTDYVSISFTHAQGDLDLRLYDASGTLIRYSDSVSNTERVSLNGLTAGTYYVQVYGYRGVFNPSYTLDIQPGAGAGPSASGRVLYLNFDGANLSRADLVRYAGNDWAHSLDHLDADRNGIQVGRFLANRSDREQVISRILELVQEDLQPFGIEVRRHTGLAVEGVGATTIFLGPSTLTNNNVHVACEVDIGNNNLTDIAFVGDENWGSTERTALALADVTLHEAGHTWGLWHVQSGTAAESMGLRYSNRDSNQWVVNTSFLDRTFAAFVDANGFQHGPGPQNSYRAMLSAFQTQASSQAVPAARTLVDTSRAGIFQITTTTAAVDTVTIRRLRSGNLQVRINGQVFELARGYRQISIFTSGDRRDRVRVLNNLGNVRVGINRQAHPEIRLAKGNERQATLWATGQHPENSHNFGCGCPLCQGGLLSPRDLLPSATSSLSLPS